jgi:hypothetical protein
MPDHLVSLQGGTENAGDWQLVSATQKTSISAAFAPAGSFKMSANSTVLQ